MILKNDRNNLSPTSDTGCSCMKMKSDPKTLGRNSVVKNLQGSFASQDMSVSETFPVVFKIG